MLQYLYHEITDIKASDESWKAGKDDRSYEVGHGLLEEFYKIF